MYGFIVLALAWAPGLLVLVMILSIKICFVFKLKLPIHLDRCWLKFIQVHLLAHHRPHKPSLTYFLW